MRIGYTYQGISQKVGGVSRYFYEICSRLQIENELIFMNRFSKNIYFNKELIKKSEFFKEFKFRGKWRIEEYLEKTHTKKILNNNKFDLIHHTGEFSQIFNYAKNTPIVITIHDMTPEIFHTENKKRLGERKICIEKSAAIICVSENTKNDLFHFFPNIDKKKVFVIYHGVSENKYSYLPNIYNKKYILYVGSRYKYKNFDFFVESISKILFERNLSLFCTGEKFTQSEEKLLKKLKIDDKVVNFGFVDDQKLANLYHNAECFVYPSLYEGFGIPILEAFQHQCPACISEKSCFPEIAKDAAMYFNPTNATSICNSIENTINNKDCLIKKGNNRVLDFSWDKAAMETEKVYNMVISNDII